MNHISQSGKWRVAPAMTLALAVLLTGCEDLLQVDLPSTITTDALDNPDIAEVIVNSAITAVECGYSRFIVGNPTGMEDAMVDHGGGAAIEYQDVISTSGCGSGNNYSWFNPFQEARYTAEDLYGRLDGWTAEELAFGVVNYDSKEQMMGITALYASVPYQIFGEVMCEVAIERGPLLAPDSILAIGEGWATKAITHIQAHIAAFKLDDGTGQPGTDAAARLIPYGISTDAEAFAYGMRARIRWARGGTHMAGAASDAAAARASDGDFVALSTRESGGENQRRNHFWAEFVENPLTTVAGVVDWWEDPSLGTNPGGPWPATDAGDSTRLIPFTGYVGLAIAADGRAVDAVGNAIDTTTAGAVLDTRVTALFGAAALDNDDAGWLQQKWTTEDDDVPIVGWQEMVLIQAEAATTAAAAIAFINELRTAASLPLVTYAPTGGEVENMIFEERRRQLWLEGRFWAAKIRNQGPTGTKLWFPRDGRQETREQDPNDNNMNGGVRMRMSNSEFDLNDNAARADRATLCIAEQRPVHYDLGDDGT